MKSTAIEKTYEPHAIEKKLYDRWEASKQFEPSGSGLPYCIMLPPPNVTGSLHMGHAFQDTLMDALIRYHRMCGRKTLWQCGTDHAGIATQIVVERQLAASGTSRQELGRARFVDAVWDWKKKSGGTITQQLRRMGASMDWNRERFTLDPDLSVAVREVFVTLYREGLIYRGKRLVNWDPVLRTAISDLEVVTEQERGNLWHMRYPVSGRDEHIIVATTRPETMLGDTAVAVNPEDHRYTHLVGETVELPLVNRLIPIISDDYVDPDFGSGCVKITPAHDFNDYEIGLRHDLPIINILSDDATINANGPERFCGLDRFKARQRVVAEMQDRGLLERIDDHALMVPRSDRTRAVVEPYLTDQWFIKIQPLAEPAIAAVETGRVRFVPDTWSKTYYEWMRNVEDWCISRQLWWGHRIPAWYDEDGTVYVGYDEKDARESSGLDDAATLRQDPDVLDTWFSSALWPFSTLGWPQKTPELENYYPTSVLVTGFDIIFFWVARMIMMGIKFMGDVPFNEVYIHGLVRDADGSKMSKSKGNILDPIDLIDGVDLETLVAKRTANLMRPEDASIIANATRRQYPEGIPAHGTDALRFTFSVMATQGRDIRFDLGRIGGYRNFCNKIWNASRFVMMACDQYYDYTSETSVQRFPERWITSRFRGALNRVHRAFNEYRFDLAAQTLYAFVWDEYCDWYIEMTKVALYDESSTQNEKEAVCRVLLDVLDGLLRALHPFMPFITEEIWLKVAPLMGVDANSIMGQSYPEAPDYAPSSADEEAFNWLRKFILGIRRIRSQYDIEPARRIRAYTKGGTRDELAWSVDFRDIISQLSRVDIDRTPRKDDQETATSLAGQMSIFVPFDNLIDRASELARLQKELKKLEADIFRAQTKLDNTNFIERAPANVVLQERDRLEHATKGAEKLRMQIEQLQ